MRSLVIISRLSVARARSHLGVSSASTGCPLGLLLSHLTPLGRCRPPAMAQGRRLAPSGEVSRPFERHSAGDVATASVTTTARTLPRSSSTIQTRCRTCLQKKSQTLRLTPSRCTKQALKFNKRKPTFKHQCLSVQQQWPCHSTWLPRRNSPRQVLQAYSHRQDDSENSSLPHALDCLRRHHVGHRWHRKIGRALSPGATRQPWAAWTPRLPRRRTRVQTAAPSRRLCTPFLQRLARIQTQAVYWLLATWASEHRVR